MEIDMKVILKMDLRAAKEFFIGKTVKNMKETSNKIKLMGNFWASKVSFVKILNKKESLIKHWSIFLSRKQSRQL